MWVTVKSTKLLFQALQLLKLFLIWLPFYHLAFHCGSLLIFHLLKSQLKKRFPSNVIIILKVKVTANNRNVNKLLYS